MDSMARVMKAAFEDDN